LRARSIRYQLSIAKLPLAKDLDGFHQTVAGHRGPSAVLLCGRSRRSARGQDPRSDGANATVRTRPSNGSLLDANLWGPDWMPIDS
jgi:hypothetical protein